MREEGMIRQLLVGILASLLKQQALPQVIERLKDVVRRNGLSDSREAMLLAGDLLKEACNLRIAQHDSGEAKEEDGRLIERLKTLLAGR